MRIAMMVLALSVGLSAAPINGGSCNGGGTAAEFALLPVGGCEQFGWRFVSLTSVNQDLEQIQIVLSDVEFPGTFNPPKNRPLIAAESSGVFNVGFYGLRFELVRPLGTHEVYMMYIRDGYTGSSNLPGFGGVEIPFTASNRIVMTQYTQTPEPATYALCGASLLAAAWLRKRPA